MLSFFWTHSILYLNRSLFDHKTFIWETFFWFYFFAFIITLKLSSNFFPWIWRPFQRHWKEFVHLAKKTLSYFLVSSDFVVFLKIYILYISFQCSKGRHEMKLGKNNITIRYRRKALRHHFLSISCENCFASFMV